MATLKLVKVRITEHVSHGFRPDSVTHPPTEQTVMIGAMPVTSKVCHSVQLEPGDVIEVEQPEADELVRVGAGVIVRARAAADEDDAA